MSQVSDKVFFLLFQNYVPYGAWVRWFDSLVHVTARKSVYGILNGVSLKHSASCMWRSFNDRERKNDFSLPYAIKINNTSPESDLLRRFCCTFFEERQIPSVNNFNCLLIYLFLNIFIIKCIVIKLFHISWNHLQYFVQVGFVSKSQF